MGLRPDRWAWSWVTRSRHLLPRGLDLAIEAAKWRLTRPPPAPGLAPLPPGEAPRVLIAPANFAGQGQSWARALERTGLALA
ncbi:MAG: hypothetical protein LBO20_02370, partial [Bifidobacteriaceae bacterium]|nr:hypothetical protein [Bifidobacteriaceae bacterium]